MSQHARSYNEGDSPRLEFGSDLQLELIRRLETGYEYIDRMVAAGGDVTKLEDFWIELLHQYEALCEDLAEAA
jgi:hypothetical protein